MEWAAVNASYAEIFKYLKANHPEYRRPQEMKRVPRRSIDTSRFCEHHQDYRHTIEQCRTLKNWVDKLMRNGELQQFDGNDSSVDQVGKKSLVQLSEKPGKPAEEPREDLVHIYSITGGYQPRGVLSLGANKKLLAEMRNHIPRGSKVVESEAYLFDGREYIVFPRPMPIATEAEARKDSMIISATI